MSRFQYDLFIIGAGSGGIRVARTSAHFGATVAIAEERYLGGTCINVGCVPKKLFVYASHFTEDFENAKGFGWQLGNTNFTWSKLIKNKNAEIERLHTVYKTLLNNSGVKVINGHATIIDEHTIEINAETIIRAERILIAAGGGPRIPDLSGKEHIISSNEAFFLKALPKKIIIVGGGYIAVEFAGIFNGLGVDTTLLYRGPLFLRGFDLDLRKKLAEEMQKKGITIEFNACINQIKKESKRLIAILQDDQQLTTEAIMYATGRHPKTDNIGLKRVGVALDENNAIKVNATYQTNIPSIYAIGDVTNKLNLTPVALAEGMALANYLYNQQDITLDYTNIPTCVFSQPNLSTVGLSEAGARKQYKEIDIYKASFKPMKRSLSNSDEISFMKLIVAKESDRVIGAHMLGEDAGEIIQGISIAIKAGATKKDFDSTIGIHPTTAEEFVTMRKAD